MKLFYSLLMISIICFTQLVGKAQFYNVQRYGVEDGLMKENIKGVNQDEKGVIWVANGLGFNVFKGDKIVTIKGDENYFQWTSSTKIIFKNKKVFTDGFVYNPIKDEFSNARLGKDVSYVHCPNGGDTIIGLQILDGHGNYWSFEVNGKEVTKNGEINGGVFINDNIKKVKLNEKQDLCPDSLFINTTYFNDCKTWKNDFFWISNFLIDNNGNSWVRTKYGLYKYDNVQQKYILFEIKTENVNSVFIDQKDRIWYTSFSHQDKLFCYSDGAISTYGTKEHGLTEVKNIIEDHSGNIWFNSETHLTKYDGINFTVFQEFQKKIQKIYIDNLGRLILQVFDKGSFLYLFTDGEFIPVLEIKNKNINTLFIDRENIIWVGAEDGLYKCIETNISYQSFANVSGYDPIEHKDIRFLYKSKKGEIYYYVYNIGIYALKKNELIPVLVENNFYPESIIEDNEEKIWVSTRKNQGNVFYKMFTIENLTASPVQSTALKEFELTNEIGLWPKLHLTQAGRIMFLSYKQGVFVYDGNDFVLYPFNSKGRNYPLTNTFSSDAFFSIQSDWMGLVKFDEIKNEFIDIITETDSVKYISNVIIDDFNTLWAFTPKRNETGYVYKLFDDILTSYPYDSMHFNVGFSSDILKDKSGNFWYITGDGGSEYKEGIVRMRTTKDGNQVSKKITETDGLTTNIVKNILFDKDSNLWIASDYGLDKLDVNFFNETGKIKIDNYSYKDGIKPGGQLYLDNEENVCLHSSFGTTVVSPLKPLNKSHPALHISNIRLNHETPDWSQFSCEFDSVNSLPQALTLDYRHNHITFDFLGISHIDPSKVRYQFYLDGFENEWQKITEQSFATYSNLPSGKYTFKVKAANNDGVWIEQPVFFTFTISPPFWETWWFRSFSGFSILFLLYSGYQGRVRQLKRRQYQLEQIVEERTTEVVREKQEADHQRDMVEEKNREILDSITYAKRLQEAILPPARVVKEYLTDSFILYKPKDIVAGDFYFMETVDVEQNEKVATLIYYVAADCTGHGVPGAMVSVVGANGLKRCIREFGLRKPGEILDKLSELVAEAFEQSEEEIKDGMDLALCCLDLSSKKLWYAGANNPLWIINPNRKSWPEKAIPFKEGGGVEFKATKQPIGHFENRKPFETIAIDLQPGDAIYTFSDGFVDQFGGEKGKKFKAANFKKLLQEHYELPMEEQKEKINEIFEGWKEKVEQVDDVCVIGVRVNGQVGEMFSQREKEIIKLLDEGKSSKMIADELNISKTTVDTHRRNMNKKAGTGSTVELLNFCKRHEVI